MRVRVDNYLQFLKKNHNKYNIIFLYGYNDGLVNLLFRDTIKILGVDENNPFLVSKLDANELKENPSILNDNLSTISIFKEKRFVLLNLLYFTFSKAIEKTILDNLNRQQNVDFVLIIKAGNLSSQSSLIRHLQTSNNCILTPCYEDEPNNIKNRIHNLFDKFAGENPMIITTEKDAMRLLNKDFASTIQKYPWFYQSIEIELDNEIEFNEIVNHYVEKNS